MRWEVKQVWVDIPWAQMLQIQYGGYVYVQFYVCDQHSFYLPPVFVLSQRTTPKHKTKTVTTVSSQLLQMLWLDYEMVKFMCLRDLFWPLSTRNVDCIIFIQRKQIHDDPKMKFRLCLIDRTSKRLLYNYRNIHLTYRKRIHC